MLEDRRSTWVWVRGVEGGEWEDGVREADAWRADLCAKLAYGMTSHAADLTRLGSNEACTPFSAPLMSDSALRRGYFSMFDSHCFVSPSHATTVQSSSL